MEELRRTVKITKYISKTSICRFQAFHVNVILNIFIDDIIVKVAIVCFVKNWLAVLQAVGSNAYYHTQTVSYRLRYKHRDAMQNIRLLHRCLFASTCDAQNCKFDS